MEHTKDITPILQPTSITVLGWTDLIIFNKSIKASNYNIDTINGKTYIFGIALTKDEKKEVINETKNIYGLQEVVPSIILVEDLSRSKN